MDENQGYKAFNNFYLTESDWKSKAKQLMKKNRDKYTIEKMGDRFISIIERYTKNLSQEVELSLPKLKKVEKVSDTSKPELKLPKLKKVGV